MKALYRKYRPIKLADVVGQDPIIKSLEIALKNGHISHAYLFTGPRGCGKTSVARIFAHEINKFEYKLEDSYTDIIEIDAASNTGVDNIRDLREKATIAPAEGKYKVYIIDEVHMLSKSAFNALLKLLEEPPEHVVFIMATTDPQKVPITITSRAQTYTFRLADKETMQKHLEKIAETEKIKITPDAINIITKRGGGSFRDSISLLDQISTLSNNEITPEIVNRAFGLPQDEVTTTLLSAYVAQDTESITSTLKDLLNLGIKPEILVDELMKSILENPKPELFPLLAKLPEVQPPFTEAKLLIALLPPISYVTPTKQNLTPQTSNNTPISTKKPTANINTPKTQPSQPQPQQQQSPQPSSPNTDSFDWQAFLDAIRPENINLHKYLTTSKPKVSNGTLHIYPERKIAARILDAKNNKALLQRFANGLAIEIHSADENPDSTPKDAQIQQISDIMGGAQEIKDEPGNPF